VGPPAVGAGVRRYPVQALGKIGDRLTLDATASHHCLVVCVTPRGTRVMVYGEGTQAEAELVDVEHGRAVLEQRTDPVAQEASTERVVVVGLTRKPALERILRMGTELGATVFRVFVARRSVARGLHPERWQRIAASSAQQCGRADVPEVCTFGSLQEALADLPDLPRFVLAPGAPTWHPEQASGVLMTGPEGGLHGDELALALAERFTHAGLGGSTLRADTAVVAALARLPIP